MATVSGLASIRGYEKSGRMSLWQRIKRERWMYLFILPGALYLLLFNYVPLIGNIVAFQNYSPFLGFRESPWVGLLNFERLFTDPDFKNALVNTIQIELLQITFAFPAPLMLALLLNSLISERVKRSLQSVVYLPHFLSWVIIIALWQQVLGGDGILNSYLRNQSLDTINIMANPEIFKPLMVVQAIWKDIGWGTIIFLAALTKIDTQLYEAAVIDGAGGWRRLRDVTLPGIRSVVVLLLILRLPRSPVVPAVLVGRLAVDTRYQGQGAGGPLLVDAISRAADLGVAVWGVVVDAIDTSAVRFYEHFGFMSLMDSRVATERMRSMRVCPGRR